MVMNKIPRGRGGYYHYPYYDHYSSDNDDRTGGRAGLIYTVTRALKRRG